MMSLRRVALCVLVSAALNVACSVTAQAAGPLLVNGAGTPLKWAANPLPFNPDRGPLGMLDNATAVASVTANFAVWAAVPTATLTFTNAGALLVDVTADNFTSFLGVCGDGLSPIIFDADGTITDAVFGTGASRNVLGFAGPECSDDTLAVISEGVAVLNGKFIDGIDRPRSNPEISLSDFNAVFIHEFGHYVNLDHSQVGLQEAFDDDPSNDDPIATMFPILVNGAQASTLNLDDEVSVSTLYPEPAFATSFGTITGSIFLADGSLFQGAYVTARKLSDPRLSAVGVASGARYAPRLPGGPPPAALQGLYEIPGLPPGDYTVDIEAIEPQFTGGSSVGPVDPPVPLPGPPEFWNGVNESNANPPDNPTDALPVAVAAGGTQSGIDVIINSEPREAADRFVSTAGSDAANDCLNKASPCRTLAHALTQAASGDTIKLAAGTYKENLFIDLSATVQLSGGWLADFSSQDPVANVTTVDGRSKDSVFSILAGKGHVIDVTLDGLTITHGRAPVGAGISAFSVGNGSLSLTLTGTTVTRNKGGGIDAFSLGSSALTVTVSNSTVTNNKGGGIAADSLATSALNMTLVNSVLANNKAPKSFGGGIDATASDGSTLNLTVTNSTLTGNKAAGGGGINAFLSGGSTAQMTVNLTNTILWGNKAEDGKDLDMLASGGTLTVNATHDDIGDVQTFSGTFNDLGDNISDDPRFVSAKKKNLHLTAGSPAIDAGTCTGAPPTDFEGDPRPSGAGCDIGADEFVP